MTRALMTLALAMATLLPGAAQAMNADPLVNHVCWYRPYCDVYGPPYVQRCTRPVTAIYCEDTYQSGLFRWYWL